MSKGSIVAPAAARPLSLSGSMEIREMRSGEEGEWDAYVTSSPAGTICHLSGWKTVVERSLGHRCYYLVARNDHGICGVFPIGYVRNPVFGDCLVSLPLAVYGGVCADDEESYFSLLNAGRELAERLGVKYLEMRNRTEPYPTSLPGRDLYVTFTQDLTPGPEKVMQGLPKDTRYMIRKSIKSGLEWTEDLSMDEFYEIYARCVHQLGTPVFPRELFSLLRSEFPRQCRLFGVRKDKKAIAGTLALYFRGQVTPYYAAGLREFNSAAPSSFMFWNLMAQSSNEGVRVFDFGRSKRGTGSFQFKTAWGMQMESLPYRYQLVSAKEVPKMSPVDAKFKLPVAAWKKLPFPLTKILGPRVIRWIPSV